MSVRWVPAAVAHPQRCAMLPTISSHHPEGFFDLGPAADGFGRVYVSVVATRMMAERMGWAPVDRQVDARVAALKEYVKAAEAERDELREKFAAIDVLASEGFRARKAPGRPKAKTAA